MLCPYGENGWETIWKWKRTLLWQWVWTRQRRLCIPSYTRGSARWGSPWYDASKSDKSNPDNGQVIHIINRIKRYLVTTNTRLEVEIRNIHFFKTKWAFRVLLNFGRKGQTEGKGKTGTARTPSSSLQYASWTPAKTLDLDCATEKAAWTTGAGREWWEWILEDIVQYKTRMGMWDTLRICGAGEENKQEVEGLQTRYCFKSQWGCSHVRCLLFVLVSGHEATLMLIMQ